MRERMKRKTKMEKERELNEKLGLPDPAIKVFETGLKQLKGCLASDMEVARERKNCNDPVGYQRHRKVKAVASLVPVTKLDFANSTGLAAIAQAGWSA